MDSSMKLILSIIMTASIAVAQGQYLIVSEAPKDGSTVEVCVNVASIAESSNLVVSITNQYFVGIPPEMIEKTHLYYNNTGDAMTTIPCIPVPLKTQDKDTVDVDVDELPRPDRMPEYAHNIRAESVADADKKAKDIEKNLFKSKKCKVKIKEKEKAK